MNSQLAALDRVDSLAERAYRALREQIAVGGLAPGERVTERGLALRLGVSPTPVREALRRLEQERLIERMGPRQLRVAERSEQSLRELLYTEAVVRAAAARFATHKITDETLDAMTHLVDDLERGALTEDPEHQLGLARRFDELLLEATSNEIIAGVIDTVSIFGWAARVRAVQAMHEHDHDVVLTRVRQHRDILDALRRRDATLVETRVREHLIVAIDYILTHAR